MVNTEQRFDDLAKVTGTNINKVASNTKSVGGIVDYNILNGLVDKEGKQVGDSFKSVVEQIPKGKEKEFWTYMSQRHNIDRAREEFEMVPKVDKEGFYVKDKNGDYVMVKNVTRKPSPVQANYTPEMSAEAVRIAEQAHPEWKQTGDGIVKWIDDFMQTWGLDTGIVNKDIYASLRETYKSYFPTQREFSELEKSIPDGVSQRFADQQTPIRKATGSERDIKDPIENIMNLVNRTVRAAKYNQVGQSLLESVRINPEKTKPFAEEIPVKDGMFANTDNVISVLMDGKPVYLRINDKPLLDAMNGLPKNINNIPYVTAVTNGVKQLITQKNPFFAVRNVFRDIPTAYVYGSEKNPLQFGSDLLGAGKDILTNSENYQRYKAVGGGGANFFNQSEATKAAGELMNPGWRENFVNQVSEKVGDNVLGKGATKITNALLHPIDTIGEFNALTETAPRLAEFNRILDKTGDVTEALHAANDVTVNFSRGGNVTKTLDKAGGMYINASVQGLDKFFRGFKDPKTAVATLTKGGVAITAPDLALYMINKDDPAYQELDNRTKDTYFLIPKGDGTFWKVPKSRELGVLFGSLFERVLRQQEGQEDSFKGFGNAVATNFAPANPFENSLYTPIISLKSNKDFADRSIVPQGMLMDGRSAYLQYDEKTTAVAKKIGELTKDIPGLEGGLSPKQIDYLIKSYTGVVGQFGIPLTVPGGNPTKSLKTQFTADPLFSNQTTTDFYDKLDKLSAAASDKNIIQGIESKKLTPEEDIKNSMSGISSAVSRGNKMITRIQYGNAPDKEEQVKVIKAQILELMNRANATDDAKEMNRIENDAKEMFLIKK